MTGDSRLITVVISPDKVYADLLETLKFELNQVITSFNGIISTKYLKTSYHMCEVEIPWSKTYNPQLQYLVISELEKAGWKVSSYGLNDHTETLNLEILI